MQKTISGFLLPECVCVCAHVHTHTPLPVYVKRFFWLGQASAFLSSSGIRLGHVLAVTIHLAERWGFGMMAGQLLACPQHLAQHLASSRIHSLLSLPSSVLGLPVTKPLLPPQPWLLPSESVWQLCQHADAMWQDRGACHGGRGLCGATLEPDLKCNGTYQVKLVVREDGAGRVESLHNGVRRAVLGRKVESWIVGVAVAKRKRWQVWGGEGLCRKGSVRPADSSDQAN